MSAAMPYRRIPRKLKKLYRRNGYTIHFTSEGRYYATCTYGPFRVDR